MKTADDWSGDLAAFLNDYKYQPDLTRLLDAIGSEDRFDQSRINEIVLWKVNRYAWINPDVIESLDALSSLSPGSHRQGEPVLSKLLHQRGVDLPMASTILRFRNPEVFQIVDRHAYRAVYGKDYPLYSQSSGKKKIELYFAYLDDLRALAGGRSIPFRNMDRILYEFDKKINGSLS